MLSMNIESIRGDRTVRAVDATAEYLSAALRILIEHAEYLDLARIDHELLLAGAPQRPGRSHS